jgi:hypothetical protein
MRDIIVMTSRCAIQSGRCNKTQSTLSVDSGDSFSGSTLLCHADLPITQHGYYNPNDGDLDSNKCVLLQSHDEESNHCCDDQVT